MSNVRQSGGGFLLDVTHTVSPVPTARVHPRPLKPPPHLRQEAKSPSLHGLIVFLLSRRHFPQLCRGSVAPGLRPGPKSNLQPHVCSSAVQNGYKLVLCFL